MDNIYYHKYLKYKKKYLELQKGGVSNSAQTAQSAQSVQSKLLINMTIKELLDFNRENLDNLKRNLIPTETYKKMLTVYTFLNNIPFDANTDIQQDDIDNVKTAIMKDNKSIENINVFRQFIQDYDKSLDRTFIANDPKKRNARYPDPHATDITSTSTTNLLDHTHRHYKVIMKCADLLDFCIYDILTANVLKKIKTLLASLRNQEARVRFERMIIISEHLAKSYDIAKKLLNTDYTVMDKKNPKNKWKISLTCQIYKTRLDRFAKLNHQAYRTFEVAAYHILQTFQKTLTHYMEALLICLAADNQHESATSRYSHLPE